MSTVSFKLESCVNEVKKMKVFLIIFCALNVKFCVGKIYSNHCEKVEDISPMIARDEIYLHLCVLNKKIRTFN